MEVQPINFTYNTRAMSEEAFNQHMILYNGYVTKINAVTAALKTFPPGGQDAAAAEAGYRGLKSVESYSINGAILHEEYFRNMTNEKKSPGGRTLRLFTNTFGGLDVFLNKMTECALAARGWCLFAYEQRTNDARLVMLDAHDIGVIVTCYPLITLDMYEHAYYLDYMTDKKRYVQDFIGSIDWDVVEKRILNVGL